MSSGSSKLLGLALVAAIVSVAPADAKARKHKKVVHPPVAAQVRSGAWGANVFPTGPLYFGNTYLGDDPDPNIRFQLWRDLGARFGGED
jgi:hypothetical protein